MNKWSLKKGRSWLIIATLLSIPAIFINLGLFPLNDDEAIRTLVAYEMDYSGNFIVPTLNGKLYFAKPPLFNWILWLSFEIFGEINEISARMPTIFFLFCYVIAIYLFSRRYIGNEYGILSALIFLTCGRVLFWDSLLAYIDICYSFVTFCSLASLYIFYEKKKYGWMFFTLYTLSGIGFLLKGFPTLLFVAISLFSYLVYNKKLKLLFDIRHFTGILVFMGIISSYYIPLYMMGDLNNTMTGLWDQSARRTIMHEQYDIGQFIIHLFTYPFENIYHFLPWSILFIYFFKMKIAWIKNSPFLTFCAIIFASNIVVYWVSVEVYPRYILMLMPFLFALLLAAHKTHYDKHSIFYQIFYRFHQFLIFCLIVICLCILFIDFEANITWKIWKVCVGMIGFGTMLYYFSKYKPIRIIVFVCVVLLSRIMFDWFVLEERAMNWGAFQCVEQAKILGKQQKDTPLSIYKSSNIDLVSSLYINLQRNKPLRRVEHIEVEGLSIFDPIRYSIPEDVEIKGEICVRNGSEQLLLLQKRQEVSELNIE